MSVFIQILLGSTVITLTVVIEALFIAVAISGLEATQKMRLRFKPMLNIVLSLSALTLWLLAGIALSIWLWAAVLLMVGEYTTLEAALYFSSVSITTLGFGDELLSFRWRQLSGFIAANGLLLFSLSTAFLFEAWRNLHQAMKSNR